MAGVAIMLTAAAGFAVPANANFIAAMSRVGSNVVMTCSNNFDTAGLNSSPVNSAGLMAFLYPSKNALFLGQGARIMRT
jgi:hypothetical protein